LKAALPWKKKVKQKHPKNGLKEKNNKNKNEEDARFRGKDDLFGFN